jgi:hypothetical protein
MDLKGVSPFRSFGRHGRNRIVCSDSRTCLPSGAGDHERLDDNYSGVSTLLACAVSIALIVSIQKGTLPRDHGSGLYHQRTIHLLRDVECFKRM